MLGLLKNNYYAARGNNLMVGILMLMLGILLIATDKYVTSLLIGYTQLAMIAFSFFALSCIRKEYTSKWAKYKLTAPVSKADIVLSYYFSQLCWLLAGIIFAAIVVALSITLHGFPFDKEDDVLLLFTSGSCICLLMNALFFPLFFLGKEEKSDVMLVISLLAAGAIFFALVSLFNMLFADWETTVVAAMLLGCAALAAALSCPLSIACFRRQEY